MCFCESEVFNIILKVLSWSLSIVIVGINQKLWTLNRITLKIVENCDADMLSLFSHTTREYRGSNQTSSRQAQVENGCEEEEEEEYSQEEQMDAEESTETRKPRKYAFFFFFSPFSYL